MNISSWTFDSTNYVLCVWCVYYVSYVLAVRKFRIFARVSLSLTLVHSLLCVGPIADSIVCIVRAPMTIACGTKTWKTMNWIANSLLLNCLLVTFRFCIVFCSETHNRTKHRFASFSRHKFISLRSIVFDHLCFTWGPDVSQMTNRNKVTWATVWRQNMEFRQIQRESGNKL